MYGQPAHSGTEVYISYTGNVHTVYVESFVENLRGISLPKSIQFISIERRNCLTHPVSCLWVAPSILLVPLTLLSENDSRSHEQEVSSTTMKHHAAKLLCSQKHKNPWSLCFPTMWLIVNSKFIQKLLGSFYRERSPVSNKSQGLFQHHDLLTLLPLSG